MQAILWRKIRAKFPSSPVGLVSCLILIGFVVILRLSGLLQITECKALDWLLRHRPTEPMDERIVIVGINEEDIKTATQYPIPDRELATSLKTLQSYHPIAIGLDLVRDLPTEPGYAELVEVFHNSKNLIGIEKVLPPTIDPPPQLSPSQIGFSDALPDPDGHYRRILLGIPTKQGYKFSFSLRLAELYLASRGITLENGLRDPQTMRFGSRELPRFFPNFEGYVNTDAEGVQTLLNYRNGVQNFRFLSLNDLKNGNFKPNWLRDRLILIGITAPSVPDLVHTNAISKTILNGQIYGVEFQAHGISQILSAVLDGRPLLTSWSEGWEYLWIVLWGILGYFLSRLTKSPLINLLSVILTSLGLVGLSYVFLLWGWWIPLIPSLFVLVLNGLVLLGFYQQERVLQTQLKENQRIIEKTFTVIHNGSLQTMAVVFRSLRAQQISRTIEQTFTLIHNGPLQTLAVVLRSLRAQQISPEELLDKLETLNLEIREIGEFLQQESLNPSEILLLGSGLKLDLKRPLNDLFYEVYSSTLARNLPYFQTLKVRIRAFEPLEQSLSREQKAALCQFLEEALCNIGKHAQGVSRICATGSQKDGWYTLSIKDNALTRELIPDGRGTKQCQNLATQLGGTFKRELLSPGTLCEIRWPVP